MTTYKITFRTQGGKEYTIQCPNDMYILDAVDEYNRNLDLNIMNCDDPNTPHAEELSPIIVDGSDYTQSDISFPYELFGREIFEQWNNNPNENINDKGLEETQEYLDLYSKKLHYTISTLEKDFKRSHKRVSYNKAKEL